MTILINDTFTDTNGTLLQNHSPDFGPSWLKHPEHANDLTIQGNRLDVSADSSYYSNLEMTALDYAVSADVQHGGSQANIINAICAQMSPTADTFYFATYVWGGTEAWTLFRREAGSNTAIGSFADSTLNTGVQNSLKLEIDGDTKRVYVDDVLRIEVEDTVLTNPGYTGQYSAGFSSPNMDNFLVEEPDGGEELFTFSFDADSIAKLQNAIFKIGVSANVAAKVFSNFSIYLDKLSDFTFDGLLTASDDLDFGRISTFTFDENLLLSGEVPLSKISTYNFNALLYADADLELNADELHIFTFGADLEAVTAINFSKISNLDVNATAILQDDFELFKLFVFEFTAEAITDQEINLNKIGNHSFDAIAIADSFFFITDYRSPRNILDSINVSYRVSFPVNAVTEINSDIIDL